MLKKLLLLSTLICSALLQASKSIEIPIILANYTDQKVAVNLKENHPYISFKQHTFVLESQTKQEPLLTYKKEMLLASHLLWSKLSPTFTVTCTCTIDDKEQTATNTCTRGALIYIENNELKLYTE